MLEEEWMAWRNPQAMLEFIQDKASDRKLRLIACACCRMIWHQLTTEGSREAVEISERFADGLVNKRLLAKARSAVRASSWNAEASKAGRASWNPGGYLAWHTTREAIGAAVIRIVISVPWSDRPVRSSTVNIDQSRDHISRLIRDIFRNPFRPVAFNPSWRTSDVLALARDIYEERAFDRMPILADALQDAGCDNDAILNHCRDANQVHIRGCWVLDLVLGRLDHFNGRLGERIS